MKRHMRWVLAAVGLAGVVVLVAAGPAAADGASQVDGIQTLVDIGDPFDPADDVSAMDGYGGGRPALIGLWYTRTFVVGVVTPSGVVTATGTEEFVGCLDADGDRSCGGSEPSGTLELTYTYSGKFDPVTFATHHGRCHHPITGGTGDFEGATGVLHFKEDPDAGCSYYTGHLTLGG
jgi:hypothetical protein